MKFNKFKNKKVKYGELSFDSKKEYLVYRKLKVLEITKKIKNLKTQVPFILIEKSIHGRSIKYIADFTYEENGELKIVDVKGFKTDVYKLKKRMMAEKGHKIIEI